MSNQEIGRNKRGSLETYICAKSGISTIFTGSFCVLKLNKKVEYALMALKYMAGKKEGELTTAREVCHHFKTPFDTVAKVMQSLNSKGILQSIKGVKGGYLLKKNLGEVTFIDLVTLLEGEKYCPDCQTVEGPCELRETCNIQHPIQKLYDLLNTNLGGLTLEKLLIENTTTESRLEISDEKRVASF